MANPKDKAKGFIDEFKAFISKGNVIDMAVGVIIATAFGKITTSLVNDVVTWKIPWRRKWPSTPVFLPGKPHGQRNLAGYSP